MSLMYFSSVLTLQRLRWFCGAAQRRILPILIMPSFPNGGGGGGSWQRRTFVPGVLGGPRISAESSLLGSSRSIWNDNGAYLELVLLEETKKSFRRIASRLEIPGKHVDSWKWANTIVCVQLLGKTEGYKRKMALASIVYTERKKQKQATPGRNTHRKDSWILFNFTIRVPLI